ncbi:hypothetical protein [Phenylobacterium sp.]|uniref:hypothetical protein n=1 Tax=Phenylobacterium sp. TaxID=1871053 RepID=UPI00286A6074|nr:hypothetical protein [Phenylobacterium sp.]
MVLRAHSLIKGVVGAGQPPPKTLADRPIRPRRALRLQADEIIAPLVTPLAPRPAMSPPGLAAPAPGPAPSPRVGAALRLGPVGCANPSLLTKAERERCLERLGAGAKDAPFYEPPMSPDKRKAFDAQAAKQQAYRRYKEGHIPPGVSTGSLGMNPMPEVWTPHN